MTSKPTPDIALLLLGGTVPLIVLYVGLPIFLDGKERGQSKADSRRGFRVMR